MVQQERIQLLNGNPIMRERPFVLYWMQASQRTRDNPALSYAIEQANALGKPLIVNFGLTGDFPDASKRHYRFLLEGLKDVLHQLREMGIRFIVSPHGPVDGTLELLPLAAMVVTDCAYTRLERAWRRNVASRCDCRLVQVESNVVVPVGTASFKEEYSAATLRRKIEPMIAHFAQSIPLEEVAVRSEDVDLGVVELQLSSIKEVMERVSVSDDATECDWIVGGETAAYAMMETFIENRLDGYGDRRNDPADPYVSHLSPFLHFGHISPVTIYEHVVAHGGPSVPVFLEELVVRRELAMNHVFYNLRYDRFDGLPEWARKSLKAHEEDPRPVQYSFDELLSAATHDPYWNAAQRELVHLGTMHGYMRMYWGKKILEWSSHPKQAFEIALDMNNRFQLDGRDPNGFTGVAWCFGKHDRPWVERLIFGNVRYMNDRGLERKFAIKAYVERIDKEIREKLSSPAILSK